MCYVALNWCLLFSIGWFCLVVGCWCLSSWFAGLVVHACTSGFL